MPIADTRPDGALRVGAVAPGAAPSPFRARHDRELRGPEQPGQLHDLRRSGQPAGPGRRRRAEPLRRDGQLRSRSTPRPGNALLGPSTLGALWAGFPIDGLHRAVRRPGRRSTTSSPTAGSSPSSRPAASTPDTPFYNCVAVSTTGDPTGTYYRYAFSPPGFNFPDYPKYGVWTDSYVLTTREFGPTVEYGIGVYGLEKNKMIERRARPARSLLPRRQRPGDAAAGRRRPAARRHRRQDRSRRTTRRFRWSARRTTSAGYGATSDALNIWDLTSSGARPRPHRSTLNDPAAGRSVRLGLPVRADGSRDCLPQPGITNPAQYLDILSYRQRPTWRLAYRNFGRLRVAGDEPVGGSRPGRRRRALVRDPPRRERARTASPAGHLSPERRRPPLDGQRRDGRRATSALGYSVVNGTNVFPGIRYTGRLAGDPLGR